MDENYPMFLKELTRIISPSGFEQEAVMLWKKEVEGAAGSVTVDIHGNGIAVLNEGKTPRIMFACHIDEVGFMLKHIDENGYLYFSAIGGLDPQLIAGQRVRIKTKNTEVQGVIGKKPIHLLDDEERKKVSKIDELWIDIGAKDKETAESIVRIGDCAVVSTGFEFLNSDKAAGRGFDDKAGVFVVTEAFKSLAKARLDCSLYGVVTVQEEIGLRGAITSAYGISPDIGIAVDVTSPSDYPTMDKRKIGDIMLGKGPVIAKGPNITPSVFDMLIKAAEIKNIPYQVQAISHGTGTDANVIQLTKAGVATGLVSIPLRYMHTPGEIISLSDLKNAQKLLEGFVLLAGGSV
jgi:tetrahedral aminopeptidase